MYIKTLEELGLSNKEARIYLKLLELGPSSVSNIASRSKINRTTAYDILESLIEYGVVSRVKGKKTKKFYLANNPEMLVAYLKNKSQEFNSKADFAEQILPELKKIYSVAPVKPNVRYYHGVDGIKAIYEDSLTSKTEIVSWQDIDNLENFSSKYFNEYYRRRAEKGIFIKAIVSDTKSARGYKKEDEKLHREMRIVSKEMMTIKPECYVYDNKVAFMSLREKFGVIIESQDIADAQRKLYELAWQKAGEN